MCLGWIDKKLERKFKNKKFGWKVFCKTTGNSLQSPIFRKKNLPTHRWLKEEDYRKNKKKKFTNVPKYEVGWHIFLFRQSARRFLKFFQTDEKRIIRKVKFKKSIVYGWQSGDVEAVVVAKEMFITNERG